MIGRVVVMEPDAYQTWLAGGPPAGVAGRARARSSSPSWTASPATAPTPRAAARVLAGHLRPRR